MDGVLVIDKPSGPTSFDVVRTVRSLLKVPKVGHTGTLDPLATGVLPICLGEATKIAGMMIEKEKTYEAVVRLGTETDTQDVAGKVTAQHPVPKFSTDDLERALGEFRGTFQQVPPMVSAIKHQGQRLYALFRKGETVERQPREVTVGELTLQGVSGNDLSLRIHCSKGFFVRSLALDLGRKLGCGAHLHALRRTASGIFSLKDALTLDALAKDGAPDLETIGKHLFSTARAVGDFPRIHVSPEDARRVLDGVPLSAPASQSGLVSVLSPTGALLAMADVVNGRLRYRRVLNEART